MADQTPPPSGSPPPPYPGATPASPGPYGPTPQNGLGTAALVMGILQFFCLGPIGSILAIVFGAIGRKKAKDGLATNGGVATAGFWLGIAGFALSVIGGIIITVGIVLGVNAASDALDPVNNQRTGLADGSYVMDPSSWLHINDRCSFGGTPTNVSTGEVASSSVTVVGAGSAQCGIDNPSSVTFDVIGGVADITEVR
ncbi:MAG: DUF4190 domain-containing protein [Actinomycetales bacterium]|nr:DUF4190 domain-containing protein [Actinomycetales bacterium]